MHWNEENIKKVKKVSSNTSIAIKNDNMLCTCQERFLFVIQISQSTIPNTSIIIFCSLSFEYSQTSQFRGGHGYCLSISLVTIKDYEWSNLVYQTHWSERMQCSRYPRAWNIKIQTSNLTSSNAISWAMTETKSWPWINMRDCLTETVEVIIILSSVYIDALQQMRNCHIDDSSFISCWHCCLPRAKMDRPVRGSPTPRSVQIGRDPIGNNIKHKRTRMMQLYIKPQYLARVEVINQSKMSVQFGKLIYVPE